MYRNQKHIKMSKRFNKEQQIAVILEAIKQMRKYGTVYNYKYGLGVCFYLSQAARSLFNDYMITVTHVDSYFNNFDFDRAIDLSEKYNFKKPNGCSNVFWWTDSKGWNTDRIKFLKALLEELN